MPVLVSLSRTKEILVIGLPIVGGMISNVLLGLIDTAMVGSLGDAALGAVGLSSFAAFIYLGMVYGFSIAVQATVSRRRGEKREAECGVPLQGAMMTVAIIAPICSAVLYVAIPSLFPLINSDPEVVALGVDYIRWLFLQAVFIG
ncbi:MATE family efflux transporter, partial [Pseudomonadales bacterium]|nr:MATE family efflux transporter [Pseudomonadales bacterium]